MLHLCYFASVREQLCCATEIMAYHDHDTVASVRTRLQQRGGVWAEVFAAAQYPLAAVNHTLAAPTTRVADGDEVAFFPPVTGG